MEPQVNQGGVCQGVRGSGERGGWQEAQASATVQPSCTVPSLKKIQRVSRGHQSLIHSGNKLFGAEQGIPFWGVDLAKTQPRLSLLYLRPGLDQIHIHSDSVFCGDERGPG